jgi:hypothetical protein
MLKYKDSLYRSPAEQVSFHTEQAGKEKRKKKIIQHPRSINLGPHSILTIFPDNTAGGEKLLSVSEETMVELAKEELDRHNQRASFIREWLTLPRRDFQPYT